jgi:hypothetical protein
MQVSVAAKPRAFATGKVRPAKAVIMDARAVEVRGLLEWNERVRWLERARG